MNRRGFILGLIAAPAIVSFGSLMAMPRAPFEPNRLVYKPETEFMPPPQWVPFTDNGRVIRLVLHGL